ncbi:MAG: hypothetical protein M3213_04100 [Thermoproteota archaeon]|nr:hypothetical protein [Thermoproteota archaeon]
MVVVTLRNAGLIYRPELLAITLSLVIALGLLLQSLDLPSSLLAIPSLSFINSAFADHGEEISLSLNDSSFAPSSDGGNQVKVVVNYATQDPMAVDDLVKGVMKVYTPNGTLIKTSSSPTPFPVSTTGQLQMATTLTENTIENITANIVFTNPIRTEIVSNELPVKPDFNTGITSASTEENRESAKAVRGEEPTALTQTIPLRGQESQQPAVIPPIPAEAAEITEQLPPPQQLAPQQIAPQEIGPQELQSIAPIAPMEPLFQGAPISTNNPTTSPTGEICTDGIDNDADTLTDFEDSNCPAVISPSKPPQQEQLASAILEICDDTLDNDLDGKTDAADEECLSTAPPNRQSAPAVQDSQNGREEEQQSEEDNEDNDNDNDADNDDDDEDGDNEGDNEDNEDDDEDNDNDN